MFNFFLLLLMMYKIQTSLQPVILDCQLCGGRTLVCLISVLSPTPTSEPGLLSSNQVLKNGSQVN
jgi:hypothetical protein